MIRNATLLREIADKIEVDPELYNQESYVTLALRREGEEGVFYGAVAYAQETMCGTAFCIAGWAVNLSGYEPQRQTYPETTLAKVSVCSIFIGPHGDTVDVSAYARGLLGLEREEARRLFAAGWKPRAGLTVPQALRALANGASMFDVSRPSSLWPIDNDFRDPLPVAEVRRLAEAEG